MKIDLHLHTTMSDGQKSIEEILELANACGVDALAITNHDIEESLEPYFAFAKKKNIQLIEGIELSALVNNNIEVHILGYNIDTKNAQLRTVCQSMLVKRSERLKKILALLSNQGINIGLEEIMLGERGLASRMHIAYTLAEKGYARTPAEALEKYLSVGKQAYIPNQALALKEAIQLILNAGGVPILAHPFRYKLTETELELLIKVCLEYGIKGIEVFYPSHNEQERQFLLKLCARLNLIPTSGTDYHRGSKDEYLERLEKCKMTVPSSLLLELVNNNR